MPAVYERNLMTCAEAARVLSMTASAVLRLAAIREIKAVGRSASTASPSSNWPNAWPPTRSHRQRPAEPGGRPRPGNEDGPGPAVLTVRPDPPIESARAPCLRSSRHDATPAKNRRDERPQGDIHSRVLLCALILHDRVDKSYTVTVTPRISCHAVSSATLFPDFGPVGFRRTTADVLRPVGPRCTSAKRPGWSRPEPSA
jgi:hypothetical protein